MAMVKKSSGCAICDGSNLASICAGCVNYRLSESYASLSSLHGKRNSLYGKVERALEAKKKMDEQLNWRLSQKERTRKLKERLQLMQKKLSQDKAFLARQSSDLKSRYELLESAFLTLDRRCTDIKKYFYGLKCAHEFRLMAISSELLHKQAVIMKQIYKLFPMSRMKFDGEKKDGYSGPYDLICHARLPRGLDPHSVPPDELAASLGYMIQLLNLVVPTLAAPVLHTSGFAGSSSRIWQRDSYWAAQPSSQSKEYPLFIPRQNLCSSAEDTSWSERNSSNFGVASVASEKKPLLDFARSSSFNYSAISPHSVENHNELQKGISLLKKSVACITAYCNNLYCLGISFELSTFEAFAKALATLSSSKEMRTMIALKMKSSRSDDRAEPLNKSAWNVNPIASTSSLLESVHSMIIGSIRESNFLNSTASFLYPADAADTRKLETLVDGWDLIEHPILPPPSQAEDIEQWTRAMFIDATKK